MSYQIYARKYRPKNFEEVVGQQSIIRTLQNAIQNGRIAQAYLFAGMRGIGKTTVARILAKAINCENGPTPTPCNKCSFCTEITDDHSVDVLEIDGASNRGIDDVRSLREGVKYKPIHSRYKIIIIDEVHMLTPPAFNALLKTLEEPPPNTVFIFATTEFHKVPETIVSRCQYFEFKKISQKDIINHLLGITKKENLTISTYGLTLIAEAADGSLRDAQSLLDKTVAFSGENISDEDLKEILGVIGKEVFTDFTKAIVEENPPEIFKLIDEIITKGYDLRIFFKEFIQHFRSLLIVKTVKSPQDILPLNDEDIADLKEGTFEMSSEEILRYLMALQHAEQGMRFSSNPQIFLETLLIKLCHFKDVVHIKDLIKEIEEMRKEQAAFPIKQRPPSISKPQRREEKPASSEIHKKNDRGNNLNKKLNDKFSIKKNPAIETQNKPKKESEIDAATKDSTVKAFMATFKAQILSVEQTKKGKN
jgi:DNA polymerase-3 subunit gamma/tau